MQELQATPLRARTLRQAQGKISSKFYGKEINDSEGESQTEIFESESSTLF